MDKSPEAFRTISEVAEVLETPAHVLRFWESRFPQIRPVKRAGGRRYYRPSDVALLTGIKRLLHDEGMTIRGVQKILREQGVRHVSGLTEEAGAEEDALGRAMAGRLDEEIEVSPEEANEATAEALREALSAPPPRGAAIYSFPAEPRAAAPAEAAGSAEIADPAADPEPGPPPTAPAPAAPAPPAAESPAPQPPPPPADAGAGMAAGMGRTAPRRPRAATAGPAPEASDEDPALATHAARLRALPRGSLALRHDALADLRTRIAELRARLARPPGGF